MINEEGKSDTESDDITEAEKKFKMLAKDDEVARKVQEEWEAEEEKKRLAEEESTKVTLTNKYDFIQHVGGKKHFDLKTKTFEEIQVLYERLKRQDHNFVAIGSAKDERHIKELNKDPKKKKGTKKRKSGHVKMLARKRPRPQPDDDSDDEHKKCLRIVTFKGTINSEIMETKSFIARLHKVSSPYGNYLVQYLKIIPEDIELILWGDLKIMMESSTKENDQGLEVEEESTAALQLGSQFTLLHSKELASPGSNSS
ncbi:hypothetical protein Tco_0981617, partial [Tanacetum coccineum]